MKTEACVELVQSAIAHGLVTTPEQMKEKLRTMRRDYRRAYRAKWMREWRQRHQSVAS